MLHRHPRMEEFYLVATETPKRERLTAARHSARLRGIRH
jgi:hypothetical protein